MNILVVNCGSSSLKYQLFSMPKEKVLVKGLIERNLYSDLRAVLKDLDNVSSIGHRVVHGGEKFKAPCLINQDVIKQIKKCSRFAPLHNPANLQGIAACKKLLPKVVQVAVFDTAFHHSLPEFAYIYGLPYNYYKELGIRKYGFHGTSHKYVALRAARILNKPLKRLKLVTCHLGNGCSIAAINHGKSIDTSMGFTPLEGLLMGTRCGDIDPALVTYIMQKKGLSIRQIDDILNTKSGLKGISGISNDMRVLAKHARAGSKRAKLAREVFIYRIKKYISAYIGIMGGVDAVIFTAGVGENQKKIREIIVKGLFSHLKNKPDVMVVPTNEELMIAQETYRVIRRVK